MRFEPRAPRREGPGCQAVEEAQVGVEVPGRRAERVFGAQGRAGAVGVEGHLKGTRFSSASCDTYARSQVNFLLHRWGSQCWVPPVGRCPRREGSGVAVKGLALT